MVRPGMPRGLPDPCPSEWERDVKTWSTYGDWESRGEKIDVAVYPVASIHHMHGDSCLCGFKSGTARGRTEHIVDRTLAALAEAGLIPVHTDGSTT